MMVIRRKLDNKGASVIELLIIMAIIAVMMGGAIIAFSVLNSSSVNQATRASKTYLTKTRTNTMSKVAKEWSVILKKDTDEYVLVVQKVTESGGTDVTEIVEEKELGTKVSAKLVVDGDEKDITSEVKFVFTPSSGSVKEVLLDGTKCEPTENMVTIKYTSGNREGNVELYFVSGNVEIK